MKQEPVTTAAVIIGAIMSIITFLTTMGLIDLTGDQVNAFRAMLTSVVPLVLTVIGGLWARSQVTPLANPRDNEGRKLVPESNQS